VHQGHRLNRSLMDPEDKETHPKVKLATKRYCFAAAITKERGLLLESLWIFCPNTAEQKKSDYHVSFNKTNYDDYFKGHMTGQNGKMGIMLAFERAFPHRKGMFILDNAGYHKYYDGIPCNTDLKQVIYDYLKAQRVHGLSEDMLKFELCELLEKKRKEEGSALERWARERGHQIVWTPPRHSELQPIELYWAAVKGAVARQYTNERTFAEIREQLHDALLEKGTAQFCTKIIAHCDRVRTELYALDLKAEDAKEPEEESEDEEDGSSGSEGES